MEEVVKKDEVKLANRWMRFRANLIDNFFTFTIIGGIANIFLAIYKTTTLGYLITGIEYQDEEGQKLQ